MCLLSFFGQTTQAYTFIPHTTGVPISIVVVGRAQHYTHVERTPGVRDEGTTNN